MPRFGPIKQKELVRCLRLHGFEGPYFGGKHPFMVKGDLTITIPNPHKDDIGKELLSRILRQAKISREEWEKI
ncbi:MAG: type II toxin-antitoxin system HicA family toxin [Nitrospirae bacterium]|nr:type II toxin-antitoxin system HicA family toxin [Nitrospirota bacterium]